VYVLHNVSDLAIDPGEERISAVIAGHSHRPAIEDRNGVLFLNPGSAGPRRFRLPVSLGRLRVGEHGIRGELLTLVV
jgi:predicted phosphodiesterase